MPYMNWPFKVHKLQPSVMLVRGTRRGERRADVGLTNRMERGEAKKIKMSEECSVNECARQ